VIIVEIATLAILFPIRIVEIVQLKLLTCFLISFPVLGCFFIFVSIAANESDVYAVSAAENKADKANKNKRETINKINIGIGSDCILFSPICKFTF
jgi:hypothetical protein